MLEQVSENPSADEVRAIAGTEPAEGIAAPTAGDQLDAGLEADRQWRKSREEQLRQGLRKADRWGAWARGGCVTAGLVECVVVVLQAAVWLAIPQTQALSLHQTATLALGLLGLAFVGLLTVSGGLGVASTLLERRLRKAARRDAIVLPEPVMPISRPSGETETAASKRIRRDRFLQREVDWAYRDQNTMGDICLWAGYASLVAWVLAPFVLLFDSLGLFLGSILALPCLGLVFVLPFAALASLYKWGRRKLLLWMAANEGLVVHDAARSPWTE